MEKTLASSNREAGSMKVQIRLPHAVGMAAIKAADRDGMVLATWIKRLIIKTVRKSLT